jgi:hypothetical protein
MRRPEADTLVTAYDDLVRAYRLAVRLGLPDVDAVFAKMNGAREALIDGLCGEAEEGRAA